MLDVNFSELLVIGVVALVVIGPERLPKVARTAGLLFGRVQRYVSEVKSDINRELKLEELRKIEADLRDSARSMEHTMTDEVKQAEQGLKAATTSVEEQVALAQQALHEETPIAAVPAEPATPATPPPAAPAEPASPQLELGLEIPPGKPEQPA